MDLLRRLAPFWLLEAALLALTATGLWLHWYPRHRDLGWGLTELAHVRIGWFGLVLWLGYVTHHAVARWGTPRRLFRGTGLALASTLAVAFGTGVWLEVPGPGLEWAATAAHFGSTFVFVALLVLHTARAWTRPLRRLRSWVRGRAGRG